MTAYAIILTFVLGAGAAEAHTFECATAMCAWELVDHAEKSPLVSRIRVYRGAPPGLMLGGSSVFPPLLDWWRS